MTHLLLLKFVFFAIWLISTEAKARVDFEKVPDNCKSCVKDVMHAFEVCKEAADHHPEEFFLCVQDVLQATSKCLECVCDIIKAIDPDFPCTSGEIISLDDMEDWPLCLNGQDCPPGWHCLFGICVQDNGDDSSTLIEAPKEALGGTCSCVYSFPRCKRYWDKCHPGSHAACTLGGHANCDCNCLLD